MGEENRRAAGTLWCSGFTDAAGLGESKGGSGGCGEKGPKVEYLFRVEATGFRVGWVWWSMVEKVKEESGF